MTNPWLHARPLPSTGAPVAFEKRDNIYLAPLPLCNFANPKYLADQACQNTCKDLPMFKTLMEEGQYMSPFCQIDKTTQTCTGYPDYNTGPSPQLMKVPPCVSCPSSDQQVSPSFYLSNGKIHEPLVDQLSNYTSLMYSVPLTESNMNEAKRVCRLMPNCEGFMVSTSPAWHGLASITFGQMPQEKPSFLYEIIKKSPGQDIQITSYVLPDRISTVPPTTQKPAKPACWEGTTPLLDGLCAYRSSELESQRRTDSDLYTWVDASGNALCKRSNASGCSYDNLS